MAARPGRGLHLRQDESLDLVLVQLDIRDFRTSNVTVGFSDYDVTEVADGWYVDDVRIEAKDPQRLPFPFTDTFENGLDNWAVSGHDWGLTTADARTARHSLTDSPAGDYLPNSWCAATLAHPLDLSGAVDPVLTFWHKGPHRVVATIRLWGPRPMAAAPGGLVSIARRQSTWSRVASGFPPDLCDYRTDNVMVGFCDDVRRGRTVADGWYVDDVRIEAKERQRLPFRSRTTSRAGRTNWAVSGHDWGLTDSTSRSARHPLTDSPAGDYLPNSWCAATLVHPLDLSGAVDPVLTFWHKGAVA